jgi:hypothetical protein
MAILTKQQIVADIDSHIRNRGTHRYSEWYVGIAADAQERLFTDHNVSRENGHWIYRQAQNDDAAREAETEFHDKGCMGGSGGGDENTVFVYAYRITQTTKE